MTGKKSGKKSSGESDESSKRRKADKETGGDSVEKLDQLATHVLLFENARFDLKQASDLLQRSISRIMEEEELVYSTNQHKRLISFLQGEKGWKGRVYRSPSFNVDEDEEDLSTVAGGGAFPAARAIRQVNRKDLSTVAGGGAFPARAIRQVNREDLSTVAAGGGAFPAARAPMVNVNMEEDLSTVVGGGGGAFPAARAPRQVNIRGGGAFPAARAPRQEDPSTVAGGGGGGFPGGFPAAPAPRQDAVCCSYSRVTGKACSEEDTSEEDASE